MPLEGIVTRPSGESAVKEGVLYGDSRVHLIPGVHVVII